MVRLIRGVNRVEWSTRVGHELGILGTPSRHKILVYQDFLTPHLGSSSALPEDASYVGPALKPGHLPSSSNLSFDEAALFL